MRVEKDFKEFIELLNENEEEGKYGDIPCFSFLGQFLMMKSSPGYDETEKFEGFPKHLKQRLFH
jgi:hypothetical protein